MEGNVSIAIQAVRAGNYIEPSPWGEKSIEIDGTKNKTKQNKTTTTTIKKPQKKLPPEPP